MAHTESFSERTDRTDKSPPLPGMTPSGLAAMGKKNMDGLAKAQAELFNTLQETSRHWFDRMQSEARLASEFAHEVTTAGSIPDAMAACREWTSRHLEMMADDNKHLLAHSQKVMKTGALLLSNGLFINGQNGAGVGTTEDRQP